MRKSNSPSRNAGNGFTANTSANPNISAETKSYDTGQTKNMMVTEGNAVATQ